MKGKGKEKENNKGKEKDNDGNGRPRRRLRREKGRQQKIIFFKFYSMLTLQRTSLILNLLGW